MDIFQDYKYLLKKESISNQNKLQFKDKIISCLELNNQKSEKGFTIEALLE
jgi:hypothetical protein